MRSTTITKRRVAAVVAGGAVLVGGGGVAYATTTASGPATPAAATTTAAAGHATGHHRLLRHERRFLARVDHATFELKVKGEWETLTYDKGNVTATSSSSITLARPDGQSVTVALGPSTKYRGHEATSAAALKTGVRARVISKDGTALAVVEGRHPLRAG